MGAVEGGPNVIYDGLVLYLDAANNKSYVSGSTSWLDLTSNQNVGTLTNGPTFNTGSGGSIVFDGTNDYVNCGFSQNVNSNTFTYCFWASPPEIAGTLLGNSKDAGGSQIYLDLTSISLVKQDSFVMGNFSTSTAKPNWNCYCISYLSPNISFYLNGILTSYATYSTTFDFTSSNRLIGGRFSVGSIYQPYKGKVAIVHLYNRVLSATEILQNYNAVKTRFGL
mgnify:FL=1